MTHILVTGGAGFIGSHACKALARDGFTPVVLDTLARGHRAAVRWGPLVDGDILDPAVLDAVFAQYRPAAVMHFAALAYVGESVDHPYPYYRTNLVGSLTLLEAMARAGCTRLVFSSTCATYGLPDRIPIPEDTPQAPVNPYGATKLAVERLLADAAAAHGLRAVCLRYFNAAGSDPDGEIGEVHDPETHLVPLVLHAALGRATLKVFGDDYATPDGSCIRDYVHVADLATAHVLGLRWLLDGGPSRAFNLGSGRGASVFEVIAAARAITGREVPFAIAPRRPGDPPILVADPTRARQELGWQPDWPEIADQIAHAWRFQAARFGGTG